MATIIHAFDTLKTAKNLVAVGQMGINNGSWLVNLLVTLGY